ncbi:SMI1/KNR4 family protein [Undibacterium sp.]|uniref:SMI1/KNR4 family protein n=1 Tax=Undibacterium sp. TaxID=1914977 RepID=UPI003752BCE0
MAFPVDETFIERAEEELGAKFPESFRMKMMKLNGGSVEVSTDHYELHPFYDTSDKKRIKRTCNSIVHETRTAHEHYRLPTDLIVIGNNGGGDVLVYKVEESGNIDSTVYKFDHETEELVFAANDFSELKQSV